MSKEEMKNKYMFCYSKHLSSWLSQNGVRYITSAKALSNDSQFWLFEKTETVDRLVELYEEAKSLRNIA